MLSDYARRNAFLRAEADYLDPPEDYETDEDEQDEDEAREDAELMRQEWRAENWELL